MPPPAVLSAVTVSEYRVFAERLADTAASVTVPLFRQPLPIEVKSDSSPFTRADCHSEQAMCALINECYPDHGIIGEEFGSRAASAEFVWVLDPIDGTRSFISGSPQYGTLIVLLAGGMPVLSVLDFPVLKERYIGLYTSHQSQALLNGSPCRVTAALPSLAQAVAATTTVAVQENDADMQLRRFLASCGQVRLGGDAFAYAGVAAGFSHLALDYLMQPYDYLPLIPLIAAAGGCISDWQGATLVPFDFQDGSRRVLASAGAALHEEALAALAAAG